MGSVSYKKKLLIGLIFSTALSAEAASTAYNSMGSMVKTMKRDAAKENLSNNYGKKLDGNLDDLESNIKQALRFSKGGGGRSAKDGLSDGDMVLISISTAATGSRKLDSLSKNLRENLLEELNRIVRQLNPRSDRDLLEDVRFAISSLNDSLGLSDSRSYRKPQKRLSYASRRDRFN